MTDISIGTGVTQSVGSDCYPFTVIDVIDARTLRVQADRAIVTRPMVEYGDTVEYAYEPDLEAACYTITLRKDGRWRTKGSSMRDRCTFHVGHRRQYYDPSF